MNSDELIRETYARAEAERIPLWKALMFELMEDLSQQTLPKELREILQMAIQYWHEGIGDLLSLKEQCWFFLERFQVGHDLESCEGRKARALLCVLEEDGDEESVSDSAEWYTSMIYG